MKLTNNHKILLGLAIGGGIAWWLTRKKSATASTSIESTKAEDLSREDKIDYIVENIVTNQEESQTGFSGERFEYDPKIGYAIPFGVVRVNSAGEEITLPREGNLAQEVFFNADGEATNNPVEEAQAILDALTDKELNIAFKVAKAKRNNPELSDDEVLNKANVGEKAKTLFRGIVKEKFNDIKALSKHPNWKKGIRRRMQMKGMSPEEKKAFREEMKAKRRERMKNRTKDRQGMGGLDSAREKFKEEMVNRSGGAMWGGYRNDGQSTNAGANQMLNRGNKPNQRGRR